MIAFKLITQLCREKVEEKINEVIDMQQLEKKQYKCKEEAERIVFTFECNKRERDATLQVIANIASNTVQERVLDRFATKELRKHKELSKEEKEAIKELFVVSNYMAKEEGVSYISYYVIYMPILKELEKHQQLNIDGWIQFRMQKYQSILQDILEQTIDDYLMQKEYLEYISFVIESKRMQEDVDEKMHLVPTISGEFSLLNANYEDVTKAYIKRYCMEFLADDEVKLEDLLLHIFITVPPKQLVIHRKLEFQNRKFIGTLEILFDGHMSYCSGCSCCQTLKEDETY